MTDAASRVIRNALGNAEMRLYEWEQLPTPPEGHPDRWQYDRVRRVLLGRWKSLKTFVVRSAPPGAATAPPEARNEK